MKQTISYLIFYIKLLNIPHLKLLFWLHYFLVYKKIHISQRRNEETLFLWCFLVNQTKHTGTLSSCWGNVQWHNMHAYFIKRIYVSKIFRLQAKILSSISTKANNPTRTLRTKFCYVKWKISVPFSVKLNFRNGRPSLRANAPPTLPQPCMCQHNHPHPRCIPKGAHAQTHKNTFHGYIWESQLHITTHSPLNARSTTQPTAIRAAGAVCSSFHVVSESTPIPPQGKRTKLLMGSCDSLFMSSFWRFSGFVPAEWEKQFPWGNSLHLIWHT